MQTKPRLLLPFLISMVSITDSSSRPAIPATAPAQTAPLEFVGGWGQRGVGPAQFSNPVSLAVDSAGNAYIADEGSGFVSKFSLLGAARLSFQDEKLVLHPTSIAVDEGRAIYVADAGRGSVFVYLTDGTPDHELRLGAPADVRSSLRIAVDGRGAIYVAGKRPFGVRRYNLRGRLLGSWGHPAAKGTPIEDPADIACGANGLVYVSEAGQGFIRVFRANGNLVRTLEVPGGGAQLAGVAVSDRYVFAADPQGHALHVWALDGSYRLRAGMLTWISSDAPSPQDVGVTSAGELLVLDAPGARVLRFRLHL